MSTEEWDAGLELIYWNEHARPFGEPPVDTIRADVASVTTHSAKFQSGATYGPVQKACLEEFVTSGLDAPRLKCIIEVLLA